MRIPIREALSDIQDIVNRWKGSPSFDYVQLAGLAKGIIIKRMELYIRETTDDKKFRVRIRSVPTVMVNKDYVLQAVHFPGEESSPFICAINDEILASLNMNKQTVQEWSHSRFKQNMDLLSKEYESIVSKQKNGPPTQQQSSNNSSESTRGKKLAEYTEKEWADIMGQEYPDGWPD